MPLGLILGLGRSWRRKRTSSLDILSSKRGPRDYYKGKNCKPTGFHTRKGWLVGRLRCSFRRFICYVFSELQPELEPNQKFMSRAPMRARASSQAFMSKEIIFLCSHTGLKLQSNFLLCTKVSSYLYKIIKNMYILPPSNITCLLIKFD